MLKIAGGPHTKDEPSQRILKQLEGMIALPMEHRKYRQILNDSIWIDFDRSDEAGRFARTLEFYLTHVDTDDPQIALFHELTRWIYNSHHECAGISDHTEDYKMFEELSRKVIGIMESRIGPDDMMKAHKNLLKYLRREFPSIMPKIVD